MKVTVKKKDFSTPVVIQSEFIKLQDAMKLAGLVMTGGEAKAVIQDGQVTVGGEVCQMRGKKLRPGEEFSYQGKRYRIQACI